jgi:Ca2+-binding EF-hand superfamily protein
METRENPKNPTFAVAALIGICALPFAVLSPATNASATSALTAADTDKDGTLDWAEVKAAASAAFDRLDQDKDTTLDYKEAAGHVGKQEFNAADVDRDKTLTKDEYLALVEKLFKAADQNKDSTLNAAELRTKAGRALERLLR